MASKLIQVTQSSAFARVYKKLNTKQKHDVDTAVEIIVANPLAGEQKRVDLSGTTDLNRCVQAWDRTNYSGSS